MSLNIAGEPEPVEGKRWGWWRGASAGAIAQVSHGDDCRSFCTAVRLLRDEVSLQLLLLLLP